jgi:beta-phosphoglucomutase
MRPSSNGDLLALEYKTPYTRVITLLNGGGDVDQRTTENCAVLWDMDGVLVDSAALHRRAWRVFLTQKGLTVTDEIFERGFGQPNEQVLPGYFPGLTDPEIRLLSAEKEACYRKLVRQEGIYPIPGVLTWMDHFSRARIHQVLATSGCRANANMIADLTGARTYLTTIVAAEDISRGKPHPDVFVRAAEQVDVPPERCLVIEDSLHGVRAARAANMRCLALETTHSAAELGEADLVIRDMRIFTWETWHKLMDTK